MLPMGSHVYTGEIVWERTCENLAAYARTQHSPTTIASSAMKKRAPPVRARPCRQGKSQPKLTAISGGPHRSAKGLITWKVASRFDLND